ncbi:MAG TPA: alanine racemase [Limnochordia bacterium]|nr:alanine racemase [Limnochordia bacterium]
MSLIRPNWAEVRLDHIAHNTRLVKGLCGDAALMAVVKANAYGHGAVPAAQAALANGAEWLGVATPGEGVELRDAGIEAPILVMGAFLSGQEALFVTYNLTATLTDRDSARALGDYARSRRQQAAAHIKVDTGMSRLGVLPEEAPAFTADCGAHPGLVVDGLFTHLATADEEDPATAQAQLDRFDHVIAACRAQGFAPRWLHAANSGALLNPALGDVKGGPGGRPRYSMVRAGIALYGLQPSAYIARTARADLRPALSWKTQVAASKVLPKGAGISYGHTHRLARTTRIAALPVGYADGYRRQLGDLAQVLVGGRRAPVVGRVCMDQMMIDVGGYEPQIGEEVVLLGRQGDAAITADEIAGWLDTINYEVTCMIGGRVPRRYRNG